MCVEKINVSNVSTDCIDGFIQLNTKEYDAIKEECTRYEDTHAAIITALKIIQKNYGWVSDNAIAAVAKILSVSIVDVESVATFYNQIFRQPVGRHIIRYCDSIVCYIMGYKSIKETLENKLGILTGDTTLDNRFTLLPTCCLGACDKSPVIMVNEDTYFNINSDNIIRLLRYYP